MLAGPQGELCRGLGLETDLYTPLDLPDMKPEDTERLIILDPDATDVVGIKETTTTAPTTKWTPPPTTTQPKPTTPAYVPNNYNWTKERLQVR